MVMKGDLTWGGKNTKQYTDDVLQIRMPETYNFIKQCQPNKLNKNKPLDKNKVVSACQCISNTYTGKHCISSTAFFLTSSLSYPLPIQYLYLPVPDKNVKLNMSADEFLNFSSKSVIFSLCSPCCYQWYLSICSGQKIQASLTISVTPHPINQPILFVLPSKY